MDFIKRKMWRFLYRDLQRAEDPPEMAPLPAFSDDPRAAGKYQELMGQNDMKKPAAIDDRRTKTALFLSLLLVGGVFIYRLTASWFFAVPGPPTRGAGRFTFDSRIETPDNLLDSDDPSKWIDWHKYGHEDEPDKWIDWKNLQAAAPEIPPTPPAVPDAGGPPAAGSSRPAMVASPEAVEAGAAADDRYLLPAKWDSGAAPMVRTFDWTIREGRIAGVADSGPVLLINDEYPGPLVECNTGDTLRIRVRNAATGGPEAGVALHWHGLELRGGQNGLDGVVGVTQCAQRPGSDRDADAVTTYEVRVGAEDAGTHWYHATTGPAHRRGLAGPIVVHGRGNGTGEVPRVDGIDRVLVLSDYYGADIAVRRAAYLGPVPRYAEPVPDGVLLNGHVDGLLSVHLHDGRAHRLRLVNAAMFASFQLEIDRHALEVLEIDGAEVDDPHPFESRSVSIAPGQRVSVAARRQNLANDPDLGRTTVWLRARIHTDVFKQDHAHLRPEIRAVVPTAMSGGDPIPRTRPCANYGGASCVCADESRLLPHRPSDLAVDVAPPMPPTADLEVPLLAHFVTLDAAANGDATAGPGLHIHRGHLNDSSGTYAALEAPPTVLERLAQLGREGHLADPVGTLDVGSTTGSMLVYYTRSPGLVVDLVLANHDADAHPFHLHGHKFWVAAMGTGSYVSGAGGVFAHPLRRDTVLVPAAGWVRLRLLLDNPGVWAFHCTVEWHKEAGMAMLFAVSVDGLAGVLEKSNMSTC